MKDNQKKQYTRPEIIENDNVGKIIKGGVAPTSGSGGDEVLQD